MDIRMGEMVLPDIDNKRCAAELIWSIVGDTKVFMDSSFGFGAVLLSRPQSHDLMKNVEVVYDGYCFLTNAWRSIVYSPDKVMKWIWSDSASEQDLSAAMSELMEASKLIGEKSLKDPEWHDPKIAGYWINFSSKFLNLADDDPKSVVDAFKRRIRHVKSVYFDWKKLCCGKWHMHHGRVVGAIFDPHSIIDFGLEDETCDKKPEDIKDWCIDFGKRKNYKIVVIGHDGEYDSLESDGWRSYKLFDLIAGKRHGFSDSVRLWASPACHEPDLSKFKKSDRMRSVDKAVEQAGQLMMNFD